MLSKYEKPQKSNLKIRKSEQALITSVLSLLNECRFTKLTVDRLCREGQLSRATFYSHFTDKYDFLEFLFFSYWAHNTLEADTYEELKEYINQLINDNKKLLRNLLIDADEQTLGIVMNYIRSTLGIAYAKDADGKITQKDIVVDHFYIKGIIGYLLWQVNNNFPSDVPMVNKHSFAAIKMLKDWANK